MRFKEQYQEYVNAPSKGEKQILFIKFQASIVQEMLEDKTQEVKDQVEAMLVCDVILVNDAVELKFTEYMYIRLIESNAT